jgi:DNA-directed RNA polymerase subunit beta
MTAKGSFIINGTERVIVPSCTVRLACSSNTTRARPTTRASCCFLARIIPYRGSWLDFEFDPKGPLDFRVTAVARCRSRFCSGHRPDELILANFFVNDSFRLMDSGAQMELVAERLRGGVARFDLTDRSLVRWTERARL